MKENLSTAICGDKDIIGMFVDEPIKDNGRKINNMVMESKHIQMGKYMRVNGETELSMELEIINFQTVMYIRENIKMTKKVAMVSIQRQMDHDLSDSGKMVNKKVLELKDSGVRYIFSMNPI